jgi:hypothetical protein
MHHMMELGTELGSDGFFVGIDNDKIVDVNNRPSQSDKQRTSGEGAPGSPKFSVDCILKNIESCKKASPRIRAKRGVNQTSLSTVNLPLVDEWILPGNCFDLLLSSAVRSRYFITRGLAVVPC